MNAPGVICNGAALYDFTKQEYLFSALLDEHARQRASWCWTGSRRRQWRRTTSTM